MFSVALAHHAKAVTGDDACVAAHDNVDVSASDTTIYLIRHAHADWRDDEARPLSSEGVAMAQVVAERLAVHPITAVYTSPSRRSIETIAPLATRLGLQPEVVPDLRERDVPAVPPSEFDELIRRAWASPDHAPGGGESNVHAQTRGLAVLRSVVARHDRSHAVVATHGNLLALMLNALDPSFAYAFWRRLSFPDIYRLAFSGARVRSVTRLWEVKA